MIEIKMFSLLLLFIVMRSGYCSKSSKTAELLHSLLANQTIGVRPGLDDNEPVKVNVSFSLVALTKLDEVKGYISTIGFYDVTWKNEKISWLQADYEGLEYISINSEKLWMPDLIVGNPAEEIYFLKDLFSKVSYNSEGTAHWKPGSVTKTYCYIQIPSYPFDEHTCFINIISWGNSPLEVILSTPTNSVNTQVYSENIEWTLIGTAAKSSIVGGNLSLAGFSFSFRRKPTFLVVNILIPIVCLSLLNTVVFLLPHESGERVSFSVTVLLSFTVFLNIIGDNIPKTSSPTPLLCYYVVVVLITGCLITLLAILCQRLHNTFGQEPAPKWLLACLFVPENKITSSLMNNKQENANGEGTITSKETVHDWKQIILKLDKILFLFFFTLALIIALGFISSMVKPA